MTALISFIQSIATSISTIVDIFISLIEDAVYVSQLTTSFLVQLPDLIAFLPPIVVATFGLSFLVATLFIVGRFL